MAGLNKRQKRRRAKSRARAAERAIIAIGPVHGPWQKPIDLGSIDQVLRTYFNPTEVEDLTYGCFS